MFKKTQALPHSNCHFLNEPTHICYQSLRSNSYQGSLLQASLLHLKVFTSQEMSYQWKYKFKSVDSLPKFSLFMSVLQLFYYRLLWTKLQPVLTAFSPFTCQARNQDLQPWDMPSCIWWTWLVQSGLPRLESEASFWQRPNISTCPFIT